MFNVSPKSIKTSDKFTRISEHFHSQVFLYQTFSCVKFQSSIRGGFQDRRKTSKIELLQKETTDEESFSTLKDVNNNNNNNTQVIVTTYYIVKNT